MHRFGHVLTPSAAHRARDPVGAGASGATLLPSGRRSRPAPPLTERSPERLRRLERNPSSAWRGGAGVGGRFRSEGVPTPNGCKGRFANPLVEALWAPNSLQAFAAGSGRRRCGAQMSAAPCEKPQLGAVGPCMQSVSFSVTRGADPEWLQGSIRKTAGRGPVGSEPAADIGGSFRSHGAPTPNGCGCPARNPSSPQWGGAGVGGRFRSEGVRGTNGCGRPARNPSSPRWGRACNRYPSRSHGAPTPNACRHPPSAPTPRRRSRPRAAGTRSLRPPGASAAGCGACSSRRRPL